MLIAGARPAPRSRKGVLIVDSNETPPSWLELESVKKMSAVEEITSLSSDNLRRNYPDLIVKLSARRDGMKLKHALAIANGTAHRA